MWLAHCRAALRCMAALLLASLEGVEPGAEAAWEDEIARRVQELDAGQVQGIPAAEVFAENGFSGARR